MTIFISYAAIWLTGGLREVLESSNGFSVKGMREHEKKSWGLLKERYEKITIQLFYQETSHKAIYQQRAATQNIPAEPVWACLLILSGLMMVWPF